MLIGRKCWSMSFHVQDAAHGTRPLQWCLFVLRSNKIEKYKRRRRKRKSRWMPLATWIRQGLESFLLWSVDIRNTHGYGSEHSDLQEAFFPGAVVRVTLSLGRQTFGSCQTNLLQKFGAHLSFQVILSVSQNNKIEPTNYSSHSVVMKLLRKRFFWVFFKKLKILWYVK